jgi:hypothetical protein
MPFISQVGTQQTKTPYEDFSKVSRPPTGETPGGVAYWGKHPEAWEELYLENLRLPGLIRINGNGFEQRLKTKKAPGRKGAKITYVGSDPANVDITLTMWTEEHLRAFESFIRQFMPNKGTSVPLRVNHPALALYNIQALTVLSAGFPVPGGREGLWTVTIKTIEWRNQPSKVETAAGPKKPEHFDIPKLGANSAFSSALQGKQDPSKNNVGPPTKGG